MNNLINSNQIISAYNDKYDQNKDSYYNQTELYFIMKDWGNTMIVWILIGVLIELICVIIYWKPIIKNRHYLNYWLSKVFIYRWSDKARVMMCLFLISFYVIHMTYYFWMLDTNSLIIAYDIPIPYKYINLREHLCGIFILDFFHLVFWNLFHSRNNTHSLYHD